MENNTTKRHLKQGKPNRYKQIKAAQDQCNEEIRQFLVEKANLGYKDFSRESFLAIIPEEILDIVQQSQIIALQERYRELIERKEILWTEDKIVAEFNKKHAIVHLDQTFILTEKTNPLGGNDFSLESRQSFRNYHEETTVQCIDGIERCIADIWLKSPKRRKYRGILFDPTTTEHKNEFYNLWKGFTKTPQPGNCSKYWQHLKDNICADNEELYLYVRKWLASIFQHPDQVHTALILSGSQGVGKNSFVEPLGTLLGSHYAPLSSINELTSNFNYHLKNAVLIHANESLWGGNKKELGAIKAMITEQTCLIESKGKDRIVVRNFKHVILSSNEEWPVHLDPDDRRFLVIRVSERCKENHEYFKALQEELNSGGYEALLYDLLNEDLTDFNPRKMPSTADAFHIKLRSSESAHRYLYEVLCEGGFSLQTNDHHIKNYTSIWQSEIPKDSVYNDYAGWCYDNGEEILTGTLFGRVIKKIIASTGEKRTGGTPRIRCYTLPSLKKAQEEFSKAFKEDPKRIFDNYEEL